ncbi:MAG: hypothetical protein IPG64_14180 [Haliea sp.]|nr:hypothetical protein [Haliea sp.]MBK6738949.1 hypothetical protein [Haliea sp.]
MKTGTESYLWTVAQVITALVLLQIVWSGVGLLLMSDPDALLPAESSLQVGEIRYDMGLDSESARDLASRPIFWQGRQAYTPAEPVESVVLTESRASAAINEVEIIGVYTGAEQSPGVIISYRGERRRLRPGDAVEDWEFTHVNQNEATFQSGGEKRALILKHAIPATLFQGKEDKAIPNPATEDTAEPQGDVTKIHDNRDE